jgi:hypothetical protein
MQNQSSVYNNVDFLTLQNEYYPHYFYPIPFQTDLYNNFENRNLFEDDDEISLSIRNNIPFIPDFFCKNEKVKNNSLEAKTTTLETNMNVNENSTSKVCSFENIKKILLLADNSDDFKNLMNNLKIDEKLKEVEKNMTILSVRKNEPKKNAKPQKRGRKKSSEEMGAHNKFSDDNIIKKIKGHFLKTVIRYINGIFNMKKDGLVILNYKKSINQIKKDNDLNILNMPIKDLLSQDITSKFKNKKNDWNKKLIESILNGNKNNEDQKFNDFVLSMKYIEWIKIYTMQDNINYLDISEAWKEKIKSKMPNIKELLTKIRNEEGNSYLSYFSFYLFNYENWFVNKKGRNRISKI